MKVNLYAVYDSGSCVYDGPVPAQTDAVAMRNFANLAGDLNTSIGKNPEYFSLWCVGTWDDASGSVEHIEKKVLCHAQDVIGGLKKKDDE